MRWSKCTKCHHECYNEKCDWCGAPTKPIEKAAEWNLDKVLERIKEVL